MRHSSIPVLLLIAFPLGAGDLARQSVEEMNRKSEGCVSAKCHVGIEPMHTSPAVRLGCTDCHGGRADTTDKLAAHILPRNGSIWRTTANPVRSYALANRESVEFIRFVNPGDLRAAGLTCGTAACHADIVYKVNHSMMTHGAFLWGAALYNNGAYPLKNASFGEPLEAVLFQSGIRHGIGVDSGFGAQYRPLLNDNVVTIGGFGALFPAAGFRDIYNGRVLYSGFVNARLVF